MSTQVENSHALTPTTAYRTDQRNTAVNQTTWLMTASLAGLSGGLIAALIAEIAEPAVEGTPDLVAGLVAGLMSGIAAGPLMWLAWGLIDELGAAAWLTVAEAVWAARRRPVRFMHLLETALERQVLRQAGAVYQFRHAALQDYLADLHTNAAVRPHPPGR